MFSRLIGGDLPVCLSSRNIGDSCPRQGLVMFLDMRTVIYARLSRRTDTNELNLEDQLKRCTEYATKQGWTVVAECSDYGESAFDRDDIEDRPGFAEVLGQGAAADVGEAASRDRGLDRTSAETRDDGLKPGRKRLERGGRLIQRHYRASDRASSRL